MKTNSDTAIAFQGVKGAYSHTAAQSLARDVLACQPKFLPCPNFEGVFQSVKGGCFGVIPLENSTIGAITRSLDLLWMHEVRIIAELLLPVHHQLIALDGACESEINRVFSHPAALDQCRLFFTNHPQLEAAATNDTAGAVDLVRQMGDRRCAAIAGVEAVLPGLRILKADIEDYPCNQTRFILVAPPDSESVCASHAVGTLEALALSVSAGLDNIFQLAARLTETLGKPVRLLSRPIPEVPFHYRLFIDFELHQPTGEQLALRSAISTDPALKRTLDRIPGLTWKSYGAYCRHNHT